LLTSFSAEAASSDDVEDGEPEVKKTKPAKKAKAAKEGGAVKKVSKRAAVPEGDTHSLIGHTYMLAGTLHNMDHKTFMQTVEVYGGTYTNKIDDAQYLVVGANPGKKADDAPDKGVTIIDEERFFEAIGADYPDPPAKRVKKSA
jgi:NAD-dependent DNA ligase